MSIRCTACAWLAAGVLFFSGRLEAQVANEDAKLLPSVPSFSDGFGSAIALSGDRALIGSPYDHYIHLYSGSADILERQPDGTWLPAAKLGPDAASPFTRFGEAVGLSGDLAAAGAPGDPEGAVDSGCVYVYRRLPGGAWLSGGKLKSSSPVFLGGFGAALSLSGERLLIGAAGEPSGSAYVFELKHHAWEEVAHLTAADAALDDAFGSSLSLDGGRALVGAFGNDDAGSQSGSAYVFERQEGGTWVEVAKLTAADAGAGDQLGTSVHLRGDRAVVGAWGDDDLGEQAGAAYVFERQGDGTWIEVAKLTAADGAPQDAFGLYVAQAGERVLVSAVFHEHTIASQGAVHVFERQGDGSWAETLELMASDGVPNGLFGRALEADQVRALAGGMQDPLVPGGKAYAFELGTLYHGAPELSAAAGGTQALLLRAAPAHAGELYVLLGSLSGTSPGVVDPSSGLVLPLNVDAYFLLLLATGGAGVISPLSGVLDQHGAADAALSLPAGLDPALAGLTVHHAYFTLDAQGGISHASNPVPVLIAP